MFCDDLLNGKSHRLNSRACIHNPDPSMGSPCQFKIAFSNPPVEFEILAIQPVGHATAVHTRQTPVYLKIQKQSEVGSEALRRIDHGLFHKRAVETASEPLIGQSCIGESVTQDDNAFTKGGEDHFLEMLCPAGQV